MFNYTNCETPYFFERNNYKIKHALFSNFIRKNKNINIKFSNYFNQFLKKTYNFKNVKNVFFDMGLNHQFVNQFNLNNNFIKFFPNYIFNKNNFLLLDNEYSHIYPIYKFIFGASYIHLHKNFFFLKPVYFTRKSWSYFFIKFCETNKVNLLFIVDHDFYIKFYKNILEFDCSVAALVPYTYCDYFIDYPLYVPITNPLVKLVYTSYVSHLYFQSYNYFNYINKYKYIHQFFRYMNFLKIN